MQDFVSLKCCLKTLSCRLEANLKLQDQRDLLLRGISSYYKLHFWRGERVGGERGEKKG